MEREFLISDPHDLRADHLSSDEAEKQEMIKRIEFLELELSKSQNNCEGVIAKLEEVGNRRGRSGKSPL